MTWTVQEEGSDPWSKKAQVRSHPHIIGQENTSRGDERSFLGKEMKKETIEKLWDLGNRTHKEEQESLLIPPCLIVNAVESVT